MYGFQEFRYFNVRGSRQVFQPVLCSFSESSDDNNEPIEIKDIWLGSCYINCQYWLPIW